MSNSTNPGDTDHARISPLSRISGLWLIPIVTLLVGLWMVYDNWANQGPLITISFSSAEGLEEGKTRIKSRNIHVGDVVSIASKGKLEGVVVTARIQPESRELLVEDAKFWVVQPTIGLSGVSGLGTLLSGQHIEFSPGISDIHTDQFEGLDKPPLTPPGTPGLHLTLNSINNFSYGEGDVILYQGLKVGKIEDIYFNSSERIVYYNVFIEAPYHKLVTNNTRFWDASGIRAELTPDGFVVQTGGLAAMMLGGITFGLPDGEPPGERVSERAYYLIYSSRAASQKEHYTQALSYILLVDNSMSGLSVGGQVMMRGIQVGEIVRAGYVPEGGNLMDTTMQIPIHIDIYPGQLGLPDTEQGKKQADAGLLLWLEQGMTASIKTGNPLFGQQLVELSLPTEPVAATVKYIDGMAVIPVATGSGISDVIAQISSLLGQFNQLQVAEIGSGVQQLLDETTATMRQVQELASSGASVMADAHQQELAETLNATLVEIRALAENYGANSPASRELNQLLEAMVDVLSNLEPLLLELKNKPNSLIFTGRRDLEQEPEAKRHE